MRTAPSTHSRARQIVGKSSRRRRWARTHTSGVARNGTATGTKSDWFAWPVLMTVGGMLLGANACSGSTDTKNADDHDGSGGSSSTQATTTGRSTTGPAGGVVTGGVVTGGVVTGGASTGFQASAGGASSTTGSGATTSSTDGGIGGDAGAPGTTTAGSGGSAGDSGVSAGQGGAAGAATGGDQEIFACEDGQAATCPTGTPLCATRDGAGSSGTSGGKFVSDSTDYSFCTEACETPGDCEFDMTGVTAAVLCAPFSGSSASVCSLDCSFGRTCPEGMVCYANTCMFEHRTCSCTGDCDGTECD